jgi:hypothetical protein
MFHDVKSYCVRQVDANEQTLYKLVAANGSYKHFHVVVQGRVSASGKS